MQHMLQVNDEVNDKVRIESLESPYELFSIRYANNKNRTRNNRKYSKSERPNALIHACSPYANC